MFCRERRITIAEVIEKAVFRPCVNHRPFKHNISILLCFLCYYIAILLHYHIAILPYYNIVILLDHYVATTPELAVLVCLEDRMNPKP